MEVFNHAYEDYQDSLDETHECALCSNQIDLDKEYCSEQCYKQDN